MKLTMNEIFKRAFAAENWDVVHDSKAPHGYRWTAENPNLGVGAHHFGSKRQCAEFLAKRLASKEWSTP